MQTQLTYRCYNEQGVMIDQCTTSMTARRAKNIFRQSYGGYIRVVCDETGETIISKQEKK